MREIWRPVLKSATAGTLNRVTVVGVRLLTVPLLLAYLGNERYGLWMTIASVTAYVTLLDFGIVSALVNKLTECFERGRRDVASTYVIATSAFLCAVAAAGTALALVMLTRVDLGTVLKLQSPAAIREALPTVMIAIVFAGLELATSALLRAPYTMQRGHIAEIHQVWGNLVSLVAILSAVRLHLGLPWIAAALMVGPVIAACGVAVHLFVIGGLRPRPLQLRQLRAVGRVLGSSAPDFIIMQVGATVLTALQFMLLAMYKGATAVAPYALLSQALLAIQIPLSALQQPLWTRLAALYQRHDIRGIRRIFLQYLGVATLYAIVAGAALVVLINPALALVLKKQMVIDLPLRVAFAIYCGLGLIVGGNLGSLLLATNLSRANAKLSVLQVTIFVALATIFTPRWGATGMVWSIISANAIALPMLAYAVFVHLHVNDATAGAHALAAPEGPVSDNNSSMAFSTEPIEISAMHGGT